MNLYKDCHTKEFQVPLIGEVPTDKTPQENHNKRGIYKAIQSDVEIDLLTQSNY